MIVIARGGGSVEDLLPFSDEALIRAVYAARTPVVSAIGHEPDSPLLDLVADVRASTPTDAAKLVVPDVAEEPRGVEQPARPGPPAASTPGWPASSTPSTRSAPGPALADPGSGLVDPRRRGRRAPRPGPAHPAPPARPGRRRPRPPARPGARRCRRWPPCSAATPCSRTPTATSSPPSTRSRPTSALQVRVADGRIARHRHRAPTTAATADRTAEEHQTSAMTEDRPSYEEAREELVEVVRRSRPAAPTSRSRWRCGSAARSSRRSARSWLDGARKRLDAAIAATRTTTTRLTPSAQARRCRTPASPGARRARRPAWWSRPSVRDQGEVAPGVGVRRPGHARDLDGAPRDALLVDVLRDHGGTDCAALLEPDVAAAVGEHAEVPARAGAGRRSPPRSRASRAAATAGRPGRTARPCARPAPPAR